VGCWLGEITSTLKQAYRDAIHGEGLTMQAAIGYLRVSTREQGRSGLDCMLAFPAFKEPGIRLNSASCLPWR
jgi:hypothetical protein